MQVSISEAARLVGLKSRSTMYRHIKKKGISVTEDEEGNPQIDTAELIRVYGDKVKLPEQGATPKTSDTPKPIQPVQNNTPKGNTSNQIELEVLKERVRHLEASKEATESERRKERELLMDQVDNLKKTIEEAQGQNKRLTALITDQSSSLKEKNGARDDEIKELKSLVMELKADNDALKAVEEERRRRQRERRKAIADKEKAEMLAEAEKSRGLFQKLFG